MTTEIRDTAKDSVESTLTSGQAITQGDMSVAKPNLAQSYDVMRQEENRKAATSGRRPLFRNFNISEMT